MTDEVMYAELHCSHCDQETLHALVYAGRLIVSSTCQTCHTQVKHEPGDLRLHYIKDLENRIATKPGRLWRRFWKSPAGVMWSTPKKVMQQPKKFWREIKSLFR